MTKPISMQDYVESSRRAGCTLIVQPRMGFSDVAMMLRGLQAVKQVGSPRVGTITLDAMTRQRLFPEAASAMAKGVQLNGFPLVTHGEQVTALMLSQVQDEDFLVQVRHGSPIPTEVFEIAARAGITAIEGGPISYCLPYGRVPLSTCVRAWSEAASFWAQAGSERGIENHLESFAGCMMGQLNPPGLLVALSVLEGLFFVENGIRSLSLSHSQGTNREQDTGALLALRRLAEEYLSPSVRYHLVLYTWMGVFPETQAGARRLIEDSGILAAITQVERVIVKTIVEAFQIPAIEDNIDALRWTAAVAAKAQGLRPSGIALEQADLIYRQAKAILDAVLNLSPHLGEAILLAFQRGILDVPFCFHPDNRNEARASLDPITGILSWERAGHIPISDSLKPKASRSYRAITSTSQALLRDLTYNQRKYDGGFNE